MPPLHGLRVLDLTQLLPGPYATSLLVELGAEVVKVEPPGGDPLRGVPPFLDDGQSARFVALNRGKKSVVLNLKAEAGRGRFLALARGAAAVVEGFRPGVVERLGVGYEAVRAVRPDVVYCALSGYGQTGPKRDHVGHDLNYVAATGALSLTGLDHPVVPGAQLGDITGGLFAALAVLGALWARQRTGRGRYLDVALADAAQHALVLHAAEWAATGKSPTPQTAPLCGGYPFYNVYETQDGRWLSVGCLEPKFWAALCRALGLEELIPHQFAEGAARGRVFDALREAFSSEPLAHWLEALDPTEVPVAPVLDVGEALGAPQAAARGLFQPPGVRSPLGVNQPVQELAPAPALGQHDAELFGEG